MNLKNQTENNFFLFTNETTKLLLLELASKPIVMYLATPLSSNRDHGFLIRDQLEGVS